MTPAQKMSFLMEMFHLIFHSKAQNIDPAHMTIRHPNLIPYGVATGRGFKNHLRGFDFDINDNKLLKLRMVEQNPNKMDAAGNRSYYANLAQQGHSIVWVIDRKPGGAWLGRIQDGQWHSARPQATTPAKSASLPHPVSEIPDIPANIGIPDYVMQAVADDEDDYGIGQYA